MARGQSFFRIADFFAHRGDQFESDESESDLRPEIHRVPIPVRHHVDPSEMRDGAVPMPHDRRRADQHQQRNVGAYSAGILQPLADIRPTIFRTTATNSSNSETPTRNV